jgi:hypothetical protein
VAGSALFVVVTLSPPARGRRCGGFFGIGIIPTSYFDEFKVDAQRRDSGSLSAGSARTRPLHSQMRFQSYGITLIATFCSEMMRL